MLARLPLLLVALSLSACTSHEGPVSTGHAPELPTTPAPTPTPAAPHADLKIAIASVMLQQDCPDPPEPVTPTGTASAEPSEAVTPPRTASAEPPMPTNSESVRSMPQPRPGAALKRSASGPGGWRPPCTQSTLQLALTNSGDAPGALEIKTVRLLDAASKRPLGTLVPRRPSLWNDTGTYQKWDQQVLPGATLKTSYSLGEPNWSEVQTKLGNTNIYTTPLLLELDIAVDGLLQTVRSPEFLRQEVHMIVT